MIGEHSPRFLSGQLVRAVLLRAFLFTVVWWAIVEGRPVGWYFAIAAVAGATLLSVALFPPGRWTLLGVVRFLPFFLLGSARGGLDVALRALLPGTRVRPGFVEHRFTAADPHVRLLVANVTSLMPGTVAARVDARGMVVHVIDRDQRAAVEFPAMLEERVRAMTAGDEPERRRGEPGP